MYKGSGLTISGADSQDKRGDSEKLVAEHVDSGNSIAGGDGAD